MGNCFVRHRNGSSMKTEFNSIYSLMIFFNRNLKYNSSVNISATINNIELPFNIYKLPRNYTFSSSNDVSNTMSLCTQDGAIQVLLGKTITVNSGITLTTPQRCRGLYIFCDNLINNGTISMTARGCIGEGKNIYLCRLNDTLQYIPAVGGSGGASCHPLSSTRYSGLAGYESSTSRGTGGGGSGGSWYDSVAWSGRGGNGTSFSGGAGGGSTTRASSIAVQNGSDIGGAGGNGNKPTSNNRSGGGVGNPGGHGYDQVGNSKSIAPSGTGGIIVIFARSCSGYFEAKGISSTPSVDGLLPDAYGGSSGGGSINIFTKTTSNITTNASGGTGNTSKTSQISNSYDGGAGGNGSVTISDYP